MRLIDSDALHKSFEEVYEHPVSMFRDSAWWFFGRLEDEPTVDAAPLVHGRWLPYENEQDKGFHHCSVCNCQAFNCEDGSEVVEVLSNYCPNCGAKMDLPEDGE